MTVHLHLVPDEVRPRTRGECRDGARPCPWAGCRYSLLLIDVSERSGRIWERSEAEVDALVETCALDLAERGAMPVKAIATFFDMTHQNVAVTVERALTKLRPLVSREMLEGWIHTTEVVPDDDDFFGPEFKAAVARAYERIVPERERGTQMLRGKPVPA